MDESELVFTYHAMVRGCERILGILSPIDSDLKNIVTLVRKMACWNDLYGKYVLESPIDDEILYLYIVEGRVVTIRPLSDRKHDYECIRKIKKKDKYNEDKWND